MTWQAYPAHTSHVVEAERPPAHRLAPPLRTFLKNAQANVDNGRLRLQDILGVKAEGLSASDGGSSDAGDGGGVAAALQHLLQSAGQLTKVGRMGVEGPVRPSRGAPTDPRMRCPNPQQCWLGSGHKQHAR
jgi:hypothetical protein